MRSGLFSVASVFFLLMYLTSCSGGFQIEKRHYRDGFYVGGGRQTNVSSKDSAGIVKPRNVETKQNETSEAAERTNTASKADSSVVTAPVTRRDSAISTVPKNEIEANQMQSIPQDSDQEVLISDVPQEARRLNTLSWIAMGMLVLGVIASIVAFMPYVSAGFGVLIAAAPFLVLAALGLGIWVLVTARRRKLSSPTAELQNYYDKLRKRARLIVILASAVIVVFVLFLALVIAALSTFQ